MTVLLAEVWRLLAGTVAWAGAVALITLAIAFVGRRESSALPALGGALVAVGLAQRLGAPFADTWSVAGRPLGAAWVVAGAIVGIGVNEVVRRRRAAG